MSKKYELQPEDIRPGDELYIQTMISIDHGWDDMCGGIAVVKHIKYDPRYPGNNDYFAAFENVDHVLNLRVVLRDQPGLEKRYKSAIAHDCPEGQRCPNPEKFHPETFKKIGITNPPVPRHLR